MADLIDRQALIDALRYYQYSYGVDVLISIQPTIEAEPVVHGRWDVSGRYRFADGSLAIRCSECGCALHEDEWQRYSWHYCPNCGAKMTEDE